MNSNIEHEYVLGKLPETFSDCFAMKSFICMNLDVKLK